MLSKQNTPLLLSTALLAHLTSAQECAGTTWSTNCCIGTLVGSSVAIPPASTFSMLPPESFTATNDFELPIPTQVMPTDAQSLTREDTPLGTGGGSDLSPEEQASLSRELESLVSDAATDTAIFSILPISASGDGPVALGTPTGQLMMEKRQDETTISGSMESGGFWDPTGTLMDMSLAPGVTCRGTVEPLEQSVTATAITDSSTDSADTSMPPSSAPAGVGETPSPGFAAPMITGAPAALLGAGLGVVMGAM